MASPWDDLFSAFNGMGRSFSRMERGWNRAGRGFSSGSLGSGWRGLLSAGRASNHGFRHSRKAVGAAVALVAGIVFVGIVLVAMANPTPENVGNVAVQGVENDLPDPGAIVVEFVLACALFVGGFFVWREIRKGQRRR